MSPIETRILELLNSVETEKFNFCQGPRGMSRPILSREKKKEKMFEIKGMNGDVAFFSLDPNVSNILDFFVSPVSFFFHWEYRRNVSTFLPNPRFSKLQ